MSEDSRGEESLETKPRKVFLKGLYVVCWVMICRSLIEIASILLAARAENDRLLERGDFRGSIIMLLAFFVCVWGLHIRLFRNPILGAGRDPLSRALIRLAKSRPPEMPDPPGPGPDE